MSMSMVTASGGMPRFERLYNPSQGTEASSRGEARGSVERKDSGDDDSARRMRRDDDGPGRRNPLVGALMQALQGLMSTRPSDSAAAPSPNPSATTASSAVTATPTAATTAPTSATTTAATASGPGDLKEAAVAFAHELFSALRNVGGGSRGDDEDGGGRAHHHHHGHGHGYGRMRNDYGNLAQGLRDLARSVELPSPAAATPSTVSTPLATPPATPAPAGVSVAPPPAPTSVPVLADATAPSSPPATTDPLAALSALPAGANVEININIQIKFNTGAAPTPATSTAPAEKPESPLLAAFKRLMEQLNPTAAPGTAASSDAESPEAKLKAFLLGIADALSGGRGGSAANPAGSTLAPVGSLISVAA